MGATGTATLDFGATPTMEASVAVTGQGTISSTSLAEAFVMGATTADHNENSHIMAGTLMRLTCNIPTPGTGFTIYADLLDGLVTGQFKVQWVWN